MSNNRKQADHLLALISLLLVVTFSHKIVHAQVSKPVDYKITTLFGGLNGDGLNATMVGINNPMHVAISPNGNVYYTDSGNNQIRYVGTDGNSHVLAGYPTYQTQDTSTKIGLYLANDTINNPYGISLTMNGDVIFTEYTGFVRRVFYNSTLGVFNMFTIAGGGNSLASNVSALSAKLSYPRCVVVASNDIYVCDSGNYMIRKIVNDTIYTVVGTGLIGNSADGSEAASSKIGQPTAMAFHPLTGELYFVQIDGTIKYIANNGSLYLFKSLSANVFGLAFASNGDLYASINSNNRIYVIKDGNVLTIANIAGSPQFGGDGGLAYNAFLSFPSGITIYGNNLYVADTSNNRIRKIDLTSNVISTIAGDGSTRYTGSNTGTRSTMNLNRPQSTFYNSQTDELLISDTGNNRVLRLNSLTNINTSLIETIAGTGIIKTDSDGKFGNQTGLDTPYSVVQSETSGDVFIGTYNRVLQLSKSTQKISTIAGTTTTLSGDNYLATYAQLNRPAGIDISPSGEIYFVDQYNHVVRKIDNSGNITTIAGTGTTGYQDGDATSAMFSFPTGLVYLPNGDLLISDTHGQRIRKYIASTRQVTSIAGTGFFGFAGDGGLAKSATIYQPSGMWYNSTSGDIIFADTANGRIRKITNSTGIISTIAGTGTSTYNGEGIPSTSTNMSPFGVTVHPISGEIYFTDNFNYLVRRIDVTGFVYTVIGVPKVITFSTSSLASSVGLNVISFMTFSANGDLYIACTDQNVIKKMDYGTNVVYNVAGTGDNNIFLDTGNATTTTLFNPIGVVVDANSGEVIFTDSIFNRVRKISTKAVKTIAGGNGDNGLAVNANVGRVLSLALTETDIYLSDLFNYRIRKVSFSSGIITSLVGTYSWSFNGDNLTNETNINSPNDIRIKGNELFFTDTGNFRIRKSSLSGQGQVSTIAGVGTFINTLVDNVVATSAYLKYPESVAFLPNGEMIISEADGHIIRKVDLNGTISLIAGQFNQPGYNGDLTDSKKALLYYPKGLSVLKDGRIIFSETGNNRVRMLTPYCNDEDYTMINFTTCVKNTFAPIGQPKFMVVQGNMVDFEFAIPKVHLPLSVIHNFLNLNTLQYDLDIPSIYSKSDILSGVSFKYDQSGILLALPTVILKNRFYIDYYNMNSSFTSTVKITLRSENGMRLVSTIVDFHFHLPPKSPPIVLSVSSLKVGTAIRSNFSVQISPWSANSDLYPLKYAIAFNTLLNVAPVRITEFSTGLNQTFVLPFLDETIGLTVMVMDSLGNVYSEKSDQQVTVYIFNGSEQEYSMIARESTLFNLITSFVHDKSFTRNSNEHLSILLNNLNVRVSDISSSVDIIQLLTEKSTFDSNFANQTISKLSELVQFQYESFNKSKSEIGYVSSTLKDNEVNTILKLSSDTLAIGLNIDTTRQLTQKLANLIILGQVSKLIQSSNDFSFSTFTSRNINMTLSSFVIPKLANTKQNQFVNQSQASVSFNSSQIVSQYSALSSECAISLVSYTNYFASSQKENDTSILSTNQISVTTDFKFLKNQQVLNLENLYEPIIISFKLDSDESDRISNQLSTIENGTIIYNLSCTYLDEMSGKWSKKGCWLSGFDTNSKTISCSCNHTTLFTTFLEQKTLDLSSRTIVQLSNVYYAQISFGLIYLTISCVVLVLLIIFRNSQPIASRLVTPYLGIIALILENGLIYIVQRSVLVDQFSKPSTSWSSGDIASNWIANIVMIIVNTMQLTAILAYVLQVSRFELMKYMYNILMEVRSKKRTQERSVLSILNKLTSKMLFGTILTIFGLINIIYWTLWVILVRTNAIEQKTYSYIVSISYIVIILSLGSIIVLISIVDWNFSLIMNLLNNRSQKSSFTNHSNKQNTDPVEKLKYEIYSMSTLKKLISLDSPLYFRSEMILFCLSFVMLVVNQALGMSTLSSRYENEVGYLKIQANDIISFIFELIYMALHILVFGGFCLSVLFLTKLRKYLRKSNIDSKDEEENREMSQLLGNEYGVSLLEEFCKKEFSTENLYLYQDLQNLTDKEELVQIYEKYIKSGSEMEVNIPSEISKKFTNIYNHKLTYNESQQEMIEKNSDKSGTIFYSETEEILELLKDNIIINLSDTFSRFVLSSEYQLFSKAQLVQQDLSKKIKLEQKNPCNNIKK